MTGAIPFTATLRLHLRLSLAGARLTLRAGASGRWQPAIAARGRVLDRESAESARGGLAGDRLSAGEGIRGERRRIRARTPAASVCSVFDRRAAFGVERGRDRSERGRVRSIQCSTGRRTGWWGGVCRGRSNGEAEGGKAHPDPSRPSVTGRFAAVKIDLNLRRSAAPWPKYPRKAAEG